MNTTSIREKRGIASHGELHIVITARKGWMPNPAVNSVVSTLCGTFRHAAEKEGKGNYRSADIYREQDWGNAVYALAEVKDVIVRMNGPHLEVEVKFDKPVMRITAPQVDPLDYTVTFRCEWQGPEYERVDTEREVKIKQAAERIRAASR